MSFRSQRRRLRRFSFDTSVAMHVVLPLMFQIQEIREHFRKHITSLVTVHPNRHFRQITCTEASKDVRARVQLNIVFVSTRKV